MSIKKIGSLLLVFALTATPTVYGAERAHDGGNAGHSTQTTHEQNEHSNRCHLRNGHENNERGNEQRCAEPTEEPTVTPTEEPTVTPTEESTVVSGEEGNNEGNNGGGEAHNPGSRGGGGGGGENTPVSVSTSVPPLQSPTVVNPPTTVPTLQVPTTVATVVGTATVTITATVIPGTTPTAVPTLVPPSFTAVPTPVLLSGGGNKLATLVKPYTRPSTGNIYHATIIPKLPSTGGGWAAHHGVN